MDIEIQKKLEQIIINPFLVDEMSLNQEEYLQENTQNLGYGQVMPIHKRHGRVQFVWIFKIASFNYRNIFRF